MSIRTYNKDHLKEHADVSLSLLVNVDSPQSSDALVFWTRHEKEPCEVNLNRFASGQNSQFKHGSGKKFKPFSGRPKLISQLTPALKEALSYASKSTVNTYMRALREWWRILDRVEHSAETTGKTMTRVDDVSLLTQIHCDFAHRSGITRQSFGTFRALVNATRMALGLNQTYWESPEDPELQKHIPPQEQRNAVRFEVRSICRNVLQRWEQLDRLSQIEAKPIDKKERILWRNVRYMRHIQKETGKVLPTPSDLRSPIAPWAINSLGTFRLCIRESVFPTHWEADAVWHQCLLNTGWNPSTLLSLDVTKNILISHFKDNVNDPHRRFVLSALTYELVGEKGRSNGKEQFITGQWKSLDGPGYLIRTYLERVEPLRKYLKEQLATAKLEYEKMKDANYKVRIKYFAQIKHLEQGCRSVWIYVDRGGKVNWLHERSSGSVTVNRKLLSFLNVVVHSLNLQRASANERLVENGKKIGLPIVSVPHVTAKDFRLWFADYVYRASHGNMLHVKRALNHSRLGTTRVYTDTNILNQEASDGARRFLNILVGELDKGRVDLTILAHLYRHDKLTPDEEALLLQARKLPKSRMNVACRDAGNPPSHIKATAGETCDAQRCLLCIENAVLLPESFDGIAMRVEELRALQAFVPIVTWIEEMYEIELKNNLLALRKFELNKGLLARKKWAQAIAAGEHYVPGLPLAPAPDLTELV